jgi:hypothetical protein
MGACPVRHIAANNAARTDAPEDHAPELRMANTRASGHFCALNAARQAFGLRRQVLGRLKVRGVANMVDLAPNSSSVIIKQWAWIVMRKWMQKVYTLEGAHLKFVKALLAAD